MDFSDSTQRLPPLGLVIHGSRHRRIIETRIGFVPEDELHRRPALEVREPDGEAC